MKKDNQNKRHYLKINIFTAIFILGLTHIFILFRYLCDNTAIGLSWSISIVFLICGLVSWVIKINKGISKKKANYLLICRLIFTGIGGILFTVNAFIFIKEITISILLVITLILIYLSICLLSCIQGTAYNDKEVSENELSIQDQACAKIENNMSDNDTNQ